MIEFIKKEYKYLLILLLVLVISIAFFWLKQINVFIDIGREFYIPSQMNKGFVLYKDILNVYSPLSYQSNAFLFKIFGESISILYNFTVLNTFVIIFGVYALAREFLDRNYSLLVSVLMIALYVVTESVFNYCFPYTFSTPYAISSFLFSVFCLVKYIKNSDPKYFYLAAFFGGMSLDFKLEYILYPCVLLYVAIFIKPLKRNELLNSLISFMLMPLFSLLILIFQGVSFSDFSSAFNIMHKMTEAPSTQYFYQNCSGFLFSPAVMSYNLKYIIVFVVMFLAISVREKVSGSANSIDKHLAGVFSFAVIYLIFSITYKNILLPLSIINLGLFLLSIKKIYQDKPLFIMVLCALIATLKSVFVFAVDTYGIFAAPFLFISSISLFLYLYSDCEKPNIFVKSIKFNLKMVLIIFIFILFYTNYRYNQDKVILSTPKGNIMVRTFVKSLHEDLIDYILKNTKQTDRIVILPETPFLNFVTDRPSHNFYMSLIPVYVDVFGEQKIITDFKKDMPEYFILNNRDCTEYGFTYFGVNFAKKIKAFIDENYVFVKEFNNKVDVMLVYERKDIRWKKSH